jgi:hypothetical protein
MPDKFKIRLIKTDDSGYDDVLSEIELEKDKFWKLILQILTMKLTAKDA